MGAGRIRPSQERIVEHPVGGVVGDGQGTVIRRHGDAVGKTAGRDDAPEDSVLGILIDGTGLIRRIRPGSCPPGVGEIQIALGVEVKVVRTLEEFVVERRDE